MPEPFEIVPGDARPLALDLWLWPLDEVDAQFRATVATHLSSNERKRAARFARPEEAAQFEIARGRLREVLGGYLGMTPSDVPFATTPHGKLILAEGAGSTGPAFNLAHAGGWAALVVGPHGLPLGIDIEPHRPVDPGLAAQYLSETEQRALDALPADDWQTGFFNAWTRKEAVLKALGAGLTRPLDSFDVTLAPGDPPRLLRLSGAVADRWQLIALSLAPKFPGCIALRHTGDTTLTVREGTLPLPESPALPG